MPATVMLLLVGTATAQDLLQPCPEVDLDVAADDAVRALTDDELAFARTVADGALAKLDCLPRVADPEDLATLYQARAGAAFYGDPQGAFAADLAAAAALHPGWFNDRLGPDLRRAWEEASAGVSGTANLSVWPIPDDGVLYVDGHAQEAQPVAVAPGPHLVQVAVGAEVLWAWSGPVEDGEAPALETGLPEPTKVRLLRDNPMLWGGLVAGLLGGGSYAGALVHDSRRGVKAQDPSHYQGLDVDDPVAELDGDWRTQRLLQGGVAVGSAAATALLTAHFVLKLRSR